MAPELGRRAGDQTRELEDANEFLHTNEQIHDKEMETLEQIATQLITARGTEALYNQILDTALAILRADAASLQMVDQEGERNRKLKLLGQRGLSVQSAKRWEWVDENSRTTCGEALRTGRKVSVADVRKCDFMAGSEDLEAFLAAGIEAAQRALQARRAVIGALGILDRDGRIGIRRRQVGGGTIALLVIALG